MGWGGGQKYGGGEGEWQRTHIFSLDSSKTKAQEILATNMLLKSQKLDSCICTIHLGH